MNPHSLMHSGFSALAHACVRSAASWWEIIHFGAVALVMVLSPSTYGRGNHAVIARHIYASTWQVLLWFTLLCALISLVLIRIVVVTAASYGLSQYALEMVVRVLVLELIPLAAALFVVLRSAMTTSTGLTAGLTADPLRTDLVPRVIAVAFSVAALAAVSCVVVLMLTYLVVYGLSPWGFVEYTRTIGRVFDPVVSITFIFKTIWFSLVVAVIPTASALQAMAEPAAKSNPLPQGTVRLFLVLMLIEGASLAIEYI